MPLSQDQIDSIKTTLAALGGLAQASAGVLAPEIIPLIIIGRGIAAVAPDLVADVQKWIEGGAPTDEQNAALAAKIAALAKPETIG